MIHALEQLTALIAPNLGGRVYVGEAPRSAKAPYVVLYPERDADVQERVTGPFSSEQIAVTAVSVGDTPEQAMWCDQHVDRALRPHGRGVVLVTANARIDNVRRRASQVGADDSATRKWRAASVYTFRQQPIN
ncbi:hypothetical protein [uncultured Gulosibacter sp.]|uniref:hypothetical protein n=1 Tax=uncultured Gulosibacter sp. TaxID=1339167 RepID=UPI00288A5450|nr:hypothetical protein [uncultured Gulosibacter sp.]